MSNQHTEKHTPWRLELYLYVLNEPTRARILSASDELVADDCDPAHARRIVACVNACEGISTEALEGWEALHLMNVAHLREQRDELLAALELCVRNAECAAEYAGTKGGNADTLTLKNAPNWPGIRAAKEKVRP